MSTYATTADFAAWLGSQTSSTSPGVYQQLTDRLNAESASGTVAQELLDQAEALMNSYFAARGYAIPVVTTEAILAAFLRSLVMKIASYHAWSTHPRLKDVPDRLESLYDEAVTWLEDFADGVTVLPSSAALATSNAGRIGARASGWARIMTEDNISTL